MCYVPAATTSFSWASCKIIRKITPVSWHSPTMWSTALLTPAANRCLRCMVRLFQHWTSVLHACAHRRRQPLGGPAPPLPPCSFSICNIEATKRGGAPPPENKKNGCQLYLPMKHGCLVRRSAKSSILRISRSSFFKTLAPKMYGLRWFKACFFRFSTCHSTAVCHLYHDQRW